jgi:ABC-type transport system involved in multi-copper enzyme maturation permease subunit
MPFRFGLGPVFKYEWLATTRRWQLYAVRSLFVSVILVAIILMWLSTRPDVNADTPRRLALIGTLIYSTMVVVQISMVLLVAPAATAGAVCLDKARGTLDHILATELSNSEVVLGKLAVRLVPVIGIVASLLPAMVLASLLGGVDPDALLGSFLVTLATAVFACTLALTFSVWGTQTHEVLFTVYFLLIGWVLAAPLGFAVCMILRVQWMAYRFWNVIKFTNPYYLTLAPYTEPVTVGYGTWLAYLVACIVLSALMVTFAIMRIRAICQKQAGQLATLRKSTEPRPPARWKLWARGPRITFLEPTLDGNPILWREWNRNRPSRWMTGIWRFYVAISLLLSGLVLLEAFRRTPGIGELVMLTTVCQVNLGLLLLNVQASASLAEERTRGSLDVLLTTPITTLQVLAGKWGGAWRILPKLMILPALNSVILVLGSSRWHRWILFLILTSSYGAFVISVGLACATWISRPGRAIAASISSCVIFNALVFMLLVLVSSSDNYRPIINHVSFASSMTGTCDATLSLEFTPYRTQYQEPSLTGILAICCVKQYLMAAVIFLATWATFDRCLGRSTASRESTHRVAQIAKRQPSGHPQAASR